MIDYLLELVHKSATPYQGRNTAREYLQAVILAALQRTGAMTSLVFHGGTALRFLYSHGRFSEDLDFALEEDKENYDIHTYLRVIQNELVPQGYGVEINLNDRKTVHSAFIRFPGLLYHIGLSPFRNETMSIKIEVDTNPPAGAGVETSIVRRYFLLQLHHHDKASLLSGKLNAILTRTYAKGRDVYDLLWYLSDPSWPSPNLEFLNNALVQAGWQGEVLTHDNWRENIRNRLQVLDWNLIQKDVRPFVEHGFDVNLLTYANLERVLK